MGLLSVVNSERPLDAHYIPKRLVWDPVMRVWLVKEAYEAFYQLSRHMQQDGVAAIQVVDGYRSYAHQKQMYEKECLKYHYKRYAKHLPMEHAAVKPPGTSEHQLGTALDFRFTNLEEQSHWLMQYAGDHGFVLRNPEDVLWHYRYIGVGHAKKIAKMNMCLEEYSRLYQQKKMK
ncbi:MAG: M15 family metallopeptidase [Cellulosilyticaceae bacterium]